MTKPGGVPGEGESQMSQTNSSHFGELTPRMQAFREEMLDEKP